MLAHLQVRRRELERLIEGPLGLGVIGGCRATPPELSDGAGERGSSRAACSRCSRASSQRPRTDSSRPTAPSSSAFPGARARAMLSSVSARRIVAQNHAVIRAKGLVTLGSRGGERQRPLGGAAGRLGHGRGGRASCKYSVRLRSSELRPRLRQRSNRAPPPARTPAIAWRRLGGSPRSSPATRPRPAGRHRRRAGSGSASPPARCLVAVPERHVQGLRHLARDVGLHLEHVGQRGVELLPPAGLGRVTPAHVHQLRGHPDPARAVRRPCPTGRWR